MAGQSQYSDIFLSNHFKGLVESREEKADQNPVKWAFVEMTVVMQFSIFRWSS
jgi:hypothetical protein